MVNRRKFIKQGLNVATAITLPLPLSVFKTINDMREDRNFDVIIVGGSYSGLSAAMALGRSLRKVLIIDGGNPCNKQTPHSHNFLTQDGEKPFAIFEKAKKQVLEYPMVQFLTATAQRGVKTKNGFEITTQSGTSFRAKKLIFATGIKDILPKIDGFAECWGISAIHCPYCHGYEVQKLKTGILAKGDTAYEMVKLISNWTNELILFTNGQSELTSEQLNSLKKRSVSIVEKPLSSIQHSKGYMEKLRFKDGSSIPLKAMYSRLPFKQHSNIPKELGCELNDQGFITVELFQNTSVPGVYACGDNTTFIRSVAQAVYAGNVAGASVNMEMIQEAEN